MASLATVRLYRLCRLYRNSGAIVAQQWWLSPSILRRGSGQAHGKALGELGHRYIIRYSPIR